MWLKARTSQVSLFILRDISLHCLQLMSHQSRSCSTACEEIRCMIDDCDYAALATKDLDYELLQKEGVGPEDVFYLRQILALFSKSDFLDIGLNPRVAAAQKFIEAEQQCLDTNRKLEFHTRRPNNIPSFVHAIHFRMIGKIAAILGAVPPIEKLACCFGPGANTSVKGAQASPRVKLSAPLTCSNDLYESGFLSELLETVPSWVALYSSAVDDDLIITKVEVVPGKVVFVPKTAKTDRTICV